ncbi:MAG: S-layer homology domain-containing protein [Clostridia bacterium]|nr:S-layer homology domain-containing protein [Clostridia bacterium]
MKVLLKKKNLSFASCFAIVLCILLSMIPVQWVWATTYGANLIVNGNAENDFNGWIKTDPHSGFYVDTAANLSVSDSTNGGKIFDYFTNGTPGSGTLEQIIDISDKALHIDAGGVRLNLIGEIRENNDAGSATIRVECLTGGNALIGSAYDVVSSNDGDGTFNWQQKSGSIAVLPADTRKLKVTLIAAVTANASDCVEFDGVQLTLIQNDTTAPTIQSAARTDNTHIIVTLSENCTNIAKANDGGFTVHETGALGTTYAVSSIAQGVDASHVILTVADMGISAKEGITVKYASGGNGSVQDTAGNALATDGVGVTVGGWDTTGPTISSGILASGNAYLDLVLSEGVYGADDGTTPLTTAKLDLTFTRNGGSATNVAISSVKKNDNAVEGLASVLTGGETTIRVFLTVTGTPNGMETIEVKPVNASSVYDKAGNAVLAVQTTGIKTLNDKTLPLLQSAVRTDNTHITVALNENCTNIAKANDGGFTVHETGAPGTSYVVASIAQGVDASHVVLTVADMGISAKEGISVKYASGGNGTVQDTSGNALATDGVGVTVSGWDTTSPTISSGTLASGNAYLDLVLSEGVYGAVDGTTPLTAAKLALTFTRSGGSATNVAISSVKRNDNAAEGSASALTGGETTIRVFLTVTGTPNGVESIEIKPANAASIYDKAGNATLIAQTTGGKNLISQVVVNPNPVSTPTPTPIPIQTPTPVPTPAAEGASTSSSAPTPTPIREETGVNIIINGKEETAAQAKTETVEENTVTTITLDDKKVEEKLNREEKKSTIVIPVNQQSDIVVGQLTGETVKKMEAKEAVLEIKTKNVTYTLPASQINIDEVSQEIGDSVKLKDIKVSVSIAEASSQTVKIVEDTANKNKYQVVVPPLDFEITCTTGEKTVQVSKFNGYVERTVAIPEGIDPSKITTGIVLNHDGTFSHVPTTIIIIDGKYHAKINSLTNSTYSVIWSPKNFKDVEKHWSKDAVNDMGSRLVVNGTDEYHFEPDKAISRGEFISVIVRALGLMRTGNGKDVFTDVTSDQFYYDAVAIAYKYGIIEGYGKSIFRPEKNVSREEAMVILSRAMKIAKIDTALEEGEALMIMNKYSDSFEAAAWAVKSISQCIKTGIVKGYKQKIMIKANITRAETAVMIQRMLKNSKLIN